MKNLLFIFIVSMLTFSCTMDGSYEVTEPALYECKDVRDGETFRFKNTNVKETRIGIGSKSYVVFIDESGKERKFTNSVDNVDSPIKCEKIKDLDNEQTK